MSGAKISDNENLHYQRFIFPDFFLVSGKSADGNIIGLTESSSVYPADTTSNPVKDLIARSPDSDVVSAVAVIIASDRQVVIRESRVGDAERRCRNDIGCGVQDIPNLLTALSLTNRH